MNRDSDISERDHDVQLTPLPSPPRAVEGQRIRLFIAIPNSPLDAPDLERVGFPSPDASTDTWISGFSNDGWRLTDFDIMYLSAALEDAADGWETDESYSSPPPTPQHNVHGLSEEVILSHLEASELYEIASQDLEEEYCCICIDQLAVGDEMGTINCGHKFHYECIKEWLKRNNACPLCRSVALTIN